MQSSFEIGSFEAIENKRLGLSYLHDKFGIKLTIDWHVGSSSPDLGVTPYPALSTAFGQDKLVLESAQDKNTILSQNDRSVFISHQS